MRGQAQAEALVGEACEGNSGVSGSARSCWLWSAAGGGRPPTLCLPVGKQGQAKMSGRTTCPPSPIACLCPPIHLVPTTDTALHQVHRLSQPASHHCRSPLPPSRAAPIVRTRPIFAAPSSKHRLQRAKSPVSRPPGIRTVGHPQHRPGKSLPPIHPPVAAAAARSPCASCPVTPSRSRLLPHHIHSADTVVCRTRADTAHSNYSTQRCCGERA